jgi:hypothetical protein
MQTFVNRCLRYILRIWWPNIISNNDLWTVTGQVDINLEIRKRKFRWIGHTLWKQDGKYQKSQYYGTLKEAGREEDLRVVGEDRPSKKRAEAGMNYGSWKLIDSSGESSQTNYVPKGTMDSIINLFLHFMFRDQIEAHDIPSRT